MSHTSHGAARARNTTPQSAPRPPKVPRLRSSVGMFSFAWCACFGVFLHGTFVFGFWCYFFLLCPCFLCIVPQVSRCFVEVSACFVGASGWFLASGLNISRYTWTLLRLLLSIKLLIPEGCHVKKKTPG